MLIEAKINRPATGLVPAPDWPILTQELREGFYCLWRGMGHVPSPGKETACHSHGLFFTIQIRRLALYVTRGLWRRSDEFKHSRGAREHACDRLARFTEGQMRFCAQQTPSGTQAPQGASAVHGRGVRRPRSRLAGLAATRNYPQRQRSAPANLLHRRRPPAFQIPKRSAPARQVCERIGSAVRRRPWLPSVWEGSHKPA